MQEPGESRVCQVCGDPSAAPLQPAIVVRPPVARLIAETVGAWDEEGWICDRDQSRFRQLYVERLLREEKGELTEIERDVVESLREHEILSIDAAEDAEEAFTLGQRLADRMAAFGGSWVFLGVFAFLLLGWMLVNSFLLAARPFDPYPYILLNLVLSTLAAIQAPVIMMSQRRQEERDRARSRHDYQVNLKAELEIRHLHQKIDHLIRQQWERLVEIQGIQLDLLDEL
ncbi:MAG: DUF1003 domain-containing protein, partial [Thermoanaerobaculia bacterium]|nr:DUF1003 domain-containing protein [Thermoanaerobaculia bacterium]